jgi:hypothetical protein
MAARSRVDCLYGSAIASPRFFDGGERLDKRRVPPPHLRRRAGQRHRAAQGSSIFQCAAGVRISSPNSRLT